MVDLHATLSTLSKFSMNAWSRCRDGGSNEEHSISVHHSILRAYQYVFAPQ